MFFFCQAEDGIRDGHVTGVQTCALPIYVVIISHSINGKSYTTLYAHLNSQSVSVGQSVSQGQEIAKSGNTGASTGPHLHFEIHQGGYGNPVNPRNHM